MLRVLLLLPFLVVLIAFALSNPQPVQLALWPTDVSIEVALSIAILLASGVAFFFGGLFVWFGAVSARTRARRAEKRAASLEAALKARPAVVPAGQSARGVPALAGPR